MQITISRRTIVPILAVSAAFSLACGGLPAVPPPSPNGSSSCLQAGDGLPADWPAVVVPEGADICKSSPGWLTLALSDDATPTLRARMDTLLASDAITDTGRTYGTRHIYQAGSVEFVVLGYIGEDSDHAGMQTQVDLQLCGLELGGGDVVCEG